MTEAQYFASFTDESDVPEEPKPTPKFKLGQILRANPVAVAKGQPLVGPVVQVWFGWQQRDDTILPMWAYRLDFPDTPGIPVVWFPEVYLEVVSSGK